MGKGEGSKFAKSLQAKNDITLQLTASAWLAQYPSSSKEYRGFHPTASQKAKWGLRTCTRTFQAPNSILIILVLLGATLENPKQLWILEFQKAS